MTITVNAAGDAVFPGATWASRTPAELGLDAAALDRFRLAIGGQGPGVVIKDGYLVYSWGDQTLKGEWASAGKSAFSTLLFFALQEGKLGDVDELITEQGWNLSSKDQTMTFRHLSNMMSGYTLPETPGTRWAYNDYGVKLLMLTLLERIFGITASSTAQVENLFTDASRLGPLQFEDGSLFVIENGVPRVNMTARDFARVGWFWLNKGRWDGAQLLAQSFFDHLRPDVPTEALRTAGGGPDDYLAVGTAGGTNNQTMLGPGKFGFMWWFNANQQTWPDAPADTFQANGHWNEEVVTVIPSLGLVAAWRGGTQANPDSFTSPMNLTLRELVSAVQQ